MKLKIADDCRVQQRDCVGGDRIAKAGVELLGHRRAADLCAALEHRHFEAGHGDIGGGDKAVMAGADDDDVSHSSSREAKRQGDPVPQPPPFIHWIASLALAMTSASAHGMRYTSNRTPWASGSLAE